MFFSPNLFSRVRKTPSSAGKRRVPLKEKIRIANNKAVSERNKRLLLQTEAEKWFFGLDEGERFVLEPESISGRFVAGILSSSSRTRNIVFCCALSALFILSWTGVANTSVFAGLSGGFLAFSLWSVFRGFERRVDAGLVFTDPVSSALVTELYRAVVPGAPESPAAVSEVSEALSESGTDEADITAEKAPPSASA